MWNFENARWRNRARMICELHLDYADGGHEVVCSDLVAHLGRRALLSNDIYSGDTYDARREIRGGRLGFDDGAWAQAWRSRPLAAVVQVMPLIRVRRELKPVEVRSFGDTSSTSGPTSRESAALRGGLEMRNGTIPHPARRRTGSGGAGFHLPRFPLCGSSCRAPAETRCRSLTALFHAHTDVKPVGEFACSNPLFNRIWKMTCQSYLLNNLMSIPTDCPQREKNGWTADAYLALEMALLNYDGITFYEKWLDDFIDNQTPPRTHFGDYPPRPDGGMTTGSAPFWDAAAFIIPLYASGQLLR